MCVRIKGQTLGYVFTPISPHPYVPFSLGSFQVHPEPKSPAISVFNVIDTHVNDLFLCKAALQISNTNTLCRSDVRYKNGLLIEIIEALF